MKIGIQTWGSYGDIRPFLALAEGLQSAGHDVTLVITCVDRPLDEVSVSPAGVAIKSVSSPVIGDREVLRIIEGTIFDEPDPTKQTQAIIEKLFLPAETAMFEAAEELCADNDLVIGHFFHYPLNAAAARSGRPYVSVALVHSAIPSASHSPAGMPNLGSVGNRFAWWLVKSVLNAKLKKYSDRLRAAHGITPARDLVEDVWTSKQLTLIAVSPQICPKKADWPEYYQVCGFLNGAAQLQDDALSDELQQFFAQGSAPIFMTFGSVMSGGDLVKTVSILRNAVEKAGARAIIQAPDWQAHGLASDDSICFVDAAPHAQVFPRCSAIVHHGGAGTSQSALLAGKPSVIVAHTSEQEFWAKEFARLNISSRPLGRKHLTAENLAERIRHVIESDAVNKNARRIGDEMRKENGVATAVTLINRLFLSQVDKLHQFEANKQI